MTRAEAPSPLLRIWYPFSVSVEEESAGSDSGSGTLRRFCC